MGITHDSLNRLNKHIKPKSNILIIGCQNLYDTEHYGQVAADYFRSMGHTVKDIDIYECNGCQIADLREDWKAESEFDLVLQHGTIEHVDGSLYQPLKNLHESCKTGGIMIHENPKTLNWPLHGQHYFTKEFWVELAKACKYEVLEVCEEAAMSNTKDGWNVCAVLLMTKDSKFVSEKQFDKIYKQYIKAK